jgi:hypothetical protein
VRTLSRREKWLLALVAVAAVALLLLRFNNPAGAPATGARAEPLPPPVPRIDLARLSTERPDGGAGNRDLFRFGSAARPGKDEDQDELPDVRVPLPTQPPALPVDSAGSGPGPAASLPPLKLTYLGSVENRLGVKVAVLLTDRKEVLTGQAGETVANRYRIARIGLESVDLEDVSSGQSRRIALRGN